MTTKHIPVLADEVVEMLKCRQGGVFLDCTLGGGGHTKLILESSEENWVYGIDRDTRALERTRQRLQPFGDRVCFLHGPFSQAEDLVGAVKFDGILADLGMSTDQLFEGRGFSFSDIDLDMRMDPTQGITAREILDTYGERDLYKVLVTGGVGGEAKAIARFLVNKRPFATARELSDAVSAAGLGKDRSSGRHAATVVFQALRMAVNNEVSEIEKLMEGASRLTKPGGRLAVITFHSLEDKLVTNRMREWESRGTYPASWRGKREGVSLGKVVTRKPIVPSDGEVEKNPASRSARLRVFEFDQIKN